MDSFENLQKENAALKEQLRKSRSWFYEVFNSASNIMAIVRAEDGVILDLNQANAELIGLNRQELIGTSVMDYSLWSNTDQREVILHAIEREGRFPNLEVDLVDRSGHVHNILLSGHSITFNDESCMLFVGTDISERKKIEDALRESEKRFLLITNTIDEIFYIYDAEKETATYLSPAYERITGYPVERVLNSREPFVDPVHPDDVEKVMEWGPLLSSGKSVSFDYRIIRSDGTVRHIWDHGYPIAEKGGKVTQYVGTGLDVTEWREAERALTESREYLSHIINCIGDPVLVKDRDHTLVLVNDAYCSFIGRRREDLIGSNGYEGLSEELSASLIEEEEKVFETGIESQTEDSVPDGENRLHVLMTKRTLLTDKSGNKQVVLVCRDITEYKRLEEQFLQVQKMDAIGALAGGVAHDFNNLLNVINGYSELARDALTEGDPVRNDIEQILEAGERAATLTAQLLAFGRKQILRPEILDLPDIIDHMSSMLRRLIGEDIDLLTRIPTAPGKILADPVKIQQIVLNLVVNARDAMPQGGKLVIEVADVDFAEFPVGEHPVTSPGSYVMLAISDNGVGMDAETRARIFEPFFTTKEKGKGTGLGLATVYGIVKQSEGYIWVYSEPGGGTTIKIYFPRVEGEPGEHIVGQKKEAEYRGFETILLVEDEEAVRDFVCRVLRERGYSVIEARDGREALGRAAEHSGPIHMVLTDVVMPGMSGKALIAELTVTRPGIQVLYISGYTDNAVVHHGILDRNTAFLEKPFSVHGLARKVREVLDS